MQLKFPKHLIQTYFRNRLRKRKVFKQAAIVTNSSNLPFFMDSLQSLLCGSHISAKQRYFRTSCKVVIISPNMPINSFRQPSTPSLFHYWVSVLNLRGRFFLQLWQFGSYSWLIETVLAGAKKYILHTQKIHGGQANSFENSALHLFIFLNFWWG